MLIFDSIVSFFIEKSADKLIESQKDRFQKKEIENKIRERSERYFSENFYQVPISNEFDYDRLNDYLYKNLEGRVAACFNAVEHKQREFFKEQLFKEAYVYAEADTREKRNTVQCYIKSILNIIENTFIERVEDMDWFLAGCMVDDIQKNVKELLNDYSMQLKDFIRYHNSFADTIDSIVQHFDIENEYHYLSKNIYFQGRKDTFAYLDNFLSAPDELLFAVITGQGGIGKSKLMYHYMLREISNSEWKIVFPTQKLIELFANQHNEWYYPKNLLVIIDYAGEIPEVVGKWINILNNINKHPVKMRIVMLERQGIVIDENGTKSFPDWYNQIKEAGGQNFDKLLYERQFYTLKTLNQDDLFALMNNIADNQGKIISQEDKIVIYNRAKELGGPENIGRFTTPLMIILLTDAFLDAKNLSHLNTKKLMEYIIGKFRKHWLKTICNNDKARYDSLEKLLVYATATNGWDLKPLPEPLADASAVFLNHYKRTNLKLILSEISEKTNSEMSLPPLEPDIVGEYFVLWYLSENTTNTNYNDFMKLLWSRPVHFTYFLNRCITSYLCDKDFDSLVDGEYSLFGEWSPAYLQSILLVNLSAQLPLERCRKVVRRLAELAKDERYSDNQDIVHRYAAGLYNLSNNQDVLEREATMERLGELAKDGRYSDNQEIMHRYATGLYNLSNNQGLLERGATIKRLGELAKDERYRDNQEIVQEYAKGLFNLSNKQDVLERAHTIEKLAELAKDESYRDNQEIVLRYAKGLFNLSNKQDIIECMGTIERLSELAKDEEYRDNQEIVLRYAKGLYNLSYKQDVIESEATVERLAELAKDERYRDNQEIVREYEKALVNRSNKQDVLEGEAAVEWLSELAKDER